MLLLTLLVSAVQGEDVTVNLSKGKLRGARLDYDFGQYYYAFKGIPYARPPVKELRFKVALYVNIGFAFHSFIVRKTTVAVKRISDSQEPYAFDPTLLFCIYVMWGQEFPLH